jgi:hypothetical protein
VNEPLDPRFDPALEDRLRAHFADRSANEPLPSEAGPAPVLPSVRAWWQRPGLLASAAALLVVAGVAAGLALAGDDDPEDLDVVGPSSTTTTEVLDPTTTTTIGGPAGTTTTTAPPGQASDVRSVIVSIDGVLGWWDGTRYVGAGDGQLPAVGGERYTLVGLDGTSAAVGSAPEPGCELSDPPGVDIDVGLEYPGPEDRLTSPPVAVSGVADPAPRSPSALASLAVYVDAAAIALQDLGVEDASPELAQLLRVDLEGDGIDEVFIVAERLSDPETLFASPGDYSVLLLRQVVDEQVVTTVVESSIAAPDESETPFVSVVRVAGFADLNGDAAMELVIRSVYYEGAGTSAWQVGPGRVELVLAAGCGA